MTLLELFSSFSYILASFVVFLYCFFYFFGISRTNRSEGDQLWVDLVITVCAKLKRILFKYSKWREPFRGKCTLTGLSELKEQRLGLILILTDKRCLRLFAVDSSPIPGPCFFKCTGKKN